VRGRESLVELKGLSSIRGCIEGRERTKKINIEIEIQGNIFIERKREKERKREIEI
jgi:hypothetical protein